MNCEIAREELLEADLSELSAAGESELARHLRECADCRARAQRILADSRDLAAAIAGMQPRRPVAEAKARALAAAEALESRRRAWRRRLSLVTPLALAAGIGALLLLGDEHGGTVPPTPRSAAPATAAALDVEAPAGTNVAVFRSDNPQIIVIWYF